MTTTSILTFDQGIMLMLEIGTFLLFYYFYSRMAKTNFYFTDIFVTTGFFALWAITVTIASNVARSLNYPIPKTSSIPFRSRYSMP